jgi:hypothetical protein
MRSKLGTVTALVFAVSIAGCSSSPSSSHTSSPTTPAFWPYDQPPAVAAAIKHWTANGGQDLFNSVGDSTESFDAVVNLNPSATDSLKVYCPQLQGHVAQAKAFKPIPYATAQVKWASALDSYAAGAKACIAGDIPTATRDMQAGDLTSKEMQNAIFLAGGLEGFK